MSLQPSPSENWEPCPQGELTELSGRLRAQRKRQQVLQAAQVTVWLMLIMLGGWMTWDWNQSSSPANPQLVQQDPAKDCPLPPDWAANEPHPELIPCGEVKALAERYLAHQLEPELEQRVGYHLSYCRRCQDYMVELEHSAHPVPFLHQPIPRFHAPPQVALSTTR
ncbi:Hypothetical protein PBC10988_29170 [Planctomycetales bacterium 10988]|nr:Hypothetical protein PBC10988_29170 [Planctomycetales bacterium 10988]